jgi:hypothetical protein
MVRLSADDIRDRFAKVGGIIRHILEPDIKTIEDIQLKGCVRRILKCYVPFPLMWIEIRLAVTSVGTCSVTLTSLSLAMDEKELAFTSRAVENAIRWKFHTQNHMNRGIVDVSGLHLESVGTHLLSLGVKIRWTFAAVGAVSTTPWQSFPNHQREVLSTAYFGPALHQKNKIIATRSH